MVKAAAGGGGRGMRIVQRQDELTDGLALARSEAENAFGSGELILEKAVITPRHVEVQVFADAHCTTLHLGERDCSVQRRHQKVLEEAPCPVMTPQLRKDMTDAAIAAAEAVEYRGAGTVEFLLAPDGAFYFLEMNTRLQVEHPVTEAITGLDLVELQILVAQGLPLPLTQDDVQLSGHAIEARLYAEDPSADFMPATGPIALWDTPTGTGLRTDSGIETGGEVSPFYDSMLAKVVGIGATRDIARQRLIAGLRDTALLGLTTNRSFLIDALAQPGFADGSATTAFIAETYPDGVPAEAASPADFAIIAALLHRQTRDRLFARSTLVSDEMLDWHSVATVPNYVTLSFGDDTHTVAVSPNGAAYDVACADQSFAIAIMSQDVTTAVITVDGRRESLHFAQWDETHIGLRRGARDLAFAVFDPLATSDTDAGGSRIVAPMPGVVISIDVAAGDSIQKGQTLAVLEAMKMQHQITAQRDGTVETVTVQAGDQLTIGALMIALEEDNT
jgi:geranyl-CoA carboxylase alpha subunit